MKVSELFQKFNKKYNIDGKDDEIPYINKEYEKTITKNPGTERNLGPHDKSSEAGKVEHGNDKNYRQADISKSHTKHDEKDMYGKKNDNSHIDGVAKYGYDSKYRSADISKPHTKHSKEGMRGDGYKSKNNERAYPVKMEDTGRLDK